MQVKILNDEEFESLPYPEMSTSVGVADPRNRTAYVRKTHMPILDAFTIAHELEHLEDGHEGVHADHYRNGVYYKGFGDIAKTSAVIGANFIPGVGPLVSAGLGTGFGAIDARKQRKKQEGMAQGYANQMGAMGGGQPMEQFKPEVAQPNVIQAGGTGGSGGSGFGGGGGSSVIDRVRGWFSGRNPQGAF